MDSFPVRDRARQHFDMDLNRKLAEHWLVQLEKALHRSVKAIMDHPNFQQLESAWLGLSTVVQAVGKSHSIKVKVLQASWQEVQGDLRSGPQLEQTLLFRKIYTETLDHPGGEPFGLMIGDYYLFSTYPGGTAEERERLLQFAGILSQAFVPFVAAVSPSFLGLESFKQLQPPLNLETLFQTEDYVPWKTFRQSEPLHFIALLLPRILIRIERKGLGGYAEKALLWGNPVYFYASRVIKRFLETGWFTPIQETQIAEAALPRLFWPTDRDKRFPLMLTECRITDRLEQQLSEIGLIAARDQPFVEQLHFYSAQTLKLPRYSRQEAERVANRINTLLHYVLCVCRFAHYIRVMIRDKVGSFTTAEDCEAFISQWLRQYCSAAKGLSLQAIAKKPLTQARIFFRKDLEGEGKFTCHILLAPHSQFDDIKSQLSLTTRVKLF